MFSAFSEWIERDLCLVAETDAPTAAGRGHRVVGVLQLVNSGAVPTPSSDEALAPQHGANRSAGSQEDAESEKTPQDGQHTTPDGAPECWDDDRPHSSHAGAEVRSVIVAPICGPILGGWISDNYHWGWIFFINVPIGIAVVVMTLQTLRNRETRTEQRRIDGVGLALLIIGIGSLQVMLDRGKELDWFASNEIIILTIVAVVAISFLIVWELTDDNPIVDLSLFKSRNFTIGCLCISLAYMLYFGAIVLLPQLLQEVYGYTATWAGLASAPVGLIPVLLSPIIGKFGNRLDMRRLVTFSFIMYAVCFYWRAYTFEPGMDFGASAWPQFVQGFAIACFFMPLTTITLSGLPPERLAAASSLSNFTRTLAGSMGTSITTTMWTNREALHHAQLTESVTPYNPNAQQMYDQLQGLGMTQQQASGWIAQQITNQGLIISANEIFWFSAAIFILLLGLVWFARPPFSAGGGGGGAH